MGVNGVRAGENTVNYEVQPTERTGGVGAPRSVTSMELAPMLNDSIPTPTIPTTESTTRVIHVRDMDHYPTAIYVGRSMPRQGLKGSPFGNPFRPKDGDAIKLFITYIGDPKRGRPLLAQLPELRNKALACWCVHHGDTAPLPYDFDPDDYRCHAEVLKWLLDNKTDAELREMAVQK